MYVLRHIICESLVKIRYFRRWQTDRHFLFLSYSCLNKVHLGLEPVFLKVTNKWEHRFTGKINQKIIKIPKNTKKKIYKNYRNSKNYNNYKNFQKLKEITKITNIPKISNIPKIWKTRKISSQNRRILSRQPTVCHICEN